MAKKDHLTEELNRHFGFGTFKGNQKAIIENVLAGKDTFVLMPTGGGKSLCYQLPSILMEGTAIVISPLIALMKNQVDAMRNFSEEDGVAHFINSSLNKSAIDQVKSDILSGRTKLLYVAPESLTKEENVDFLRQVKISFYAVDEAHCISEWGHDFRPEYRRIRPIINEIGKRPLIALTATATPKVQHDIQKNLGMIDATVFKSSFNRSNLYYEVRPKGTNIDREIIKYIKANEGKSGIVYCLSRKKVEEFADILKANGIKALPYHAGMDSQVRSANQDAFLMVIPGGPSEKVGLMAGDRIIQVDDTLIAGVKMKTTDIMKKLRGPKGTEVRVKVKRGKSPELMDFKIVRGKIPVYSLDAAYMADKNTGYIKLNRFAASSADEFREALEKLRKQGMKNLILDLQGNGGGYLNIAIELADEFLDKNRLIVYTKGSKQPREEANSTARGQFQEGRLVVLVDESSASASEIVSGAIQDWDRGVIVGRRTFGKGLVQKPIPLPDGSMIRLTVSRYYTPTGRCIQKPYENGKMEEYHHDLIDRYNRGELMSADSIHFPDSMKYNTLVTERTVYGGGGIMPDVFIPVDTTRYTDYHRKLVASGLVNRVSMNYLDRNRNQMMAKYPKFQQYKQGFVVGEDIMEELLKMAGDEKIEFEEEQYNRSKPLIMLQIKALIARDLYDMAQYFQIINDDNPSYQKALQIINNKETYNRLLGR